MCKCSYVICKFITLSKISTTSFKNAKQLVFWDPWYIHAILLVIKDKVGPIPMCYAMEVCKGCSDKAVHTLTLRTRWDEQSNSSALCLDRTCWNSLGRRLSGPLSQSWCGGEEKNLSVCQDLSSCYPACNCLLYRLSCSCSYAIHNFPFNICHLVAQSV
jgi:hypothetical protein